MSLGWESRDAAADYTDKYCFGNFHGARYFGIASFAASGIASDPLRRGIKAD